MKLRKLLIGLFILNIVLISSAQERIIFRHIGTQDGLSNGSIKSILQDNEGFIWFGTIDGLNKYDGIRFKVYNYSKNDEKSLSADDVSSIFQDSSGRIWIGTFGGGLNLYHKETDSFSLFQVNSDSVGSISSNEINVIFEDSKKQIWVGTELGLNKYQPDANTFQAYKLISENPSSISSNSVKAIYEDQNGIFWIGTFGGGLNSFDPNSEIFTHYKFNVNDNNSIPSDFVLDIESFGNLLFIGTSGAGLSLFDPKTEMFIDFFERYANEYEEIQIVKDLYTDSKGILWVGTDGGGLFKIMPLGNDEKINFKVSAFHHSNRLKSSVGSNAIYKIYEDCQRNIWIGTAWSGISIIEHTQGNVKFFYSDIEGLDPLPVLSSFVDEDSVLWIGSDGKGLYSHNSSTGEIRNYSELVPGFSDFDYIQLIDSQESNELWIGTYANGLINFNHQSNTIRSYKNDPSNPFSISHNNVRSLLRGDKGDLWVATWGGGISYFNSETEQFANYMHDENNTASLSNNNVVALERAANGKLWVGTFGGGLNLFDPQTGSATVFLNKSDKQNSLSGNNILCLHKDQNECLWIGTWGAGLTKFDVVKQEFNTFGLESGLVNNTVTAIEEDSEGILWLSTKKGVCSFNPKTNEFKVLNINRTSRVNEFHINSSFQDDIGNLYFGGIEGLISFNPKNLSNTATQLKVKLTGFELFNKEVKVGENSPLAEQITYSDQIVLNHKQSVFTIQFAAFDFPFSDNCQYAIIMEGFEENWREIGTQNSATYTNLSPGTYIFKVKARIFNSDWGDEYAQIGITVKPAAMKSWWAISIYVFVFLLLLYVFQRYTFIWAKLKNNLKLERLKREQESSIHQLKIRFFTNISHELRTPLTLILDPLNELIEAGKGGAVIQRPLKTIKRNTDRLLQLVNEFLDFRRIELGKISIRVAKGNIVGFTHEVFLSFKEYARAHSINYKLNAPKEKIAVWYDRSQMEKVIYNLISNAFKHTHENGSILVSISADDNYAYITVEDTGEGIQKDQLPHVFERFYQTDSADGEHRTGFGIGLSIAKELVNMHKGEINVSSQLGIGSVFTIILPLGKDHFAEDLISKDHKNSEQIENYRYKVFSDEPETSQPEEFSELKGNSVLVVEDNEDLRKYLVDSLSPIFNVIFAANGKEGIEMALDNIPDIIVSDVMMPVADGIELCRVLKSDMRTSHIPIILLTARTASLYKLQGFETGADEYLTKPFRMDELKIRIKNLLNNRGLLRERFLREALLQPKEVLVSSPDEKFLFNLVETIENNIDQTELKVDLLIRELCMSHSVLYKKVKALTGQSLIEFVRDIRLKRAAQLLGQNKLSVKEICYQVGFTDRKYFSQVFKKKFGETPSEYAKQKKEI